RTSRPLPRVGALLGPPAPPSCLVRRLSPIRLSLAPHAPSPGAFLGDELARSGEPPGLTLLERHDATWGTIPRNGCGRPGARGLQAALRPRRRRMLHDHDAQFLCSARRSVLSDGSAHLVLCEPEPYGGVADAPREPDSRSALSAPPGRARGRENLPDPHGARPLPPAAP